MTKKYKTDEIGAYLVKIEKKIFIKSYSKQNAEKIKKYTIFNSSQVFWSFYKK